MNVAINSIGSDSVYESLNVYNTYLVEVLGLFCFCVHMR